MVASLKTITVMFGWIMHGEDLMFSSERIQRFRKGVQRDLEKGRDRPVFAKKIQQKGNYIRPLEQPGSANVFENENMLEIIMRLQIEHF